jgi:hypothetical protein
MAQRREASIPGNDASFRWNLATDLRAGELSVPEGLAVGAVPGDVAKCRQRPGPPAVFAHPSCWRSRGVDDMQSCCFQFPLCVHASG